jgi:hypothetical protein
MLALSWRWLGADGDAGSIMGKRPNTLPICLLFYLGLLNVAGEQAGALRAAAPGLCNLGGLSSLPPSARTQVPG